MAPSREELEAKKVPELKEECQKLGLPVTGKKSDLIDRILAAAPVAAPAAAADAAPAPAAAAAPVAAPAAAVAEPASNGGAAAAAASNGKHQRIEFSLGEAAAEAEAAPAAKPAHKIIKLGGDDEAPAAAAAAPAAPAVPPAAGDIEAVATLTAEERKKLRGAKFGMTEDDKKKKRAERFNLHTADEEEEKKLKRRQRFGLVTDADEKVAQEAKKAELLDPAKLKARAERFGPKPTAGMSDEEKKKAREARFKAAK